MNIQEILLLMGLLAKDAQQFVNPSSTAGQVIGLSADTVAAIQAVLQRHSSLVGMPIEDVLKTL